MAIHIDATIFAVGASVCTWAAIGLYLWSLHTKRSEPYAWAWLLRIGLALLAFLSQLAKGASYSLALSGTQVAGGLFIVGLILARHHGQLKKGLDHTDSFALGAATTGVAVWLLSGEALFALWGAILADAAATLMGVKEAWLRGRSESVTFWLLSLCAGLCALASGWHGTLAVVLYPLFTMTNGAVNIATILAVRLRRKWAQALAAQTESDVV
ncbi:MAG TPA: hypothetical protein VKQ34_00960 [Candidatus Saccharimonadales bacterium]|nr:hypothetical protein [Candidatus Saccharimonadales bacterium]